MRWLLWPVNEVVSLANNSASNWIPQEGYHHPKLGIIINASCAGMNFFLIAFLLCAYLLQRRRSDWWMLPTAALLAWPLTIAANTARILTLLRVGEPQFGISPGVWHEGWGALIYLFFLTAAGLLLQARFSVNSVSTNPITD